jgi:hypothetical protein
MSMFCIKLSILYALYCTSKPTFLRFRFVLRDVRYSRLVKLVLPEMALIALNIRHKT